MGVDGKWSQLNDRVTELQQERDRLSADLTDVQQQLETMQNSDVAVLIAERNELRQQLRQQLRGEASRLLVLTAEEQEAMDAINRALEIIGPGWGLRANREELLAAVHTIQGFVQHHMLCRLAPDRWSTWWTAEGN